eukprot:m.176499 g.176499  ORF g.176499 m.176499 type:complete len:169 (+) comp15445_c0_seq9:375-881(+)
MTQHFVPPQNFGYVEEDVFRSGLPQGVNFTFLEKLKLKTVVYLSPEAPSPQLLEFLADHKINLCHFQHHTRQSVTGTGSSVPEEVVLSALNIILDRSKYPLLISCQRGRHHTGTVVGCLRKLQRWNLTSILEEYRRHAGAKVINVNEQFIEFFDTDLVVVPQDKPKWL